MSKNQVVLLLYVSIKRILVIVIHKKPHLALIWSEGFASVGTRYQPSQNHSISYSSFDKQFLERTPTTYVRPEFVPYTQSSQPFVESDRPYAPPEKINPVIVNKKHIDESVDFRKSKDYENALKSCDEALKADPKYLDGWNEKACDIYR